MSTQETETTQFEPTSGAEERWWVALRSIPFWTIHVAAVAGVIVLGWSWTGLALAVALYYTRMFPLTAGYHRYFSHRTFKTSRVMQFLFALGGTLAVQKGVLWWAANHRLHHRHVDNEQDPHSPRHRGFWWSHVGWILSNDHVATEYDQVKDLARYPELRWLNRYNLLPPFVLALVLLAVGGWWALVWGFLVSTVMLWHGTFLVNSAAHLVGSRRYETKDDSRNSLWLALITMGEGWHNNHHHHPGSVRQGLYWYEIDGSWLVLKVMAWLGLVWDLRAPPRSAFDEIRQAPPPSEAAPSGR